MSTRVLT